MTFDIAELCDAYDLHGPIIRVVIANVSGSAPREIGASMLVWPGGQSGTIGGGTLEHEAAARARKQTESSQVLQVPLGPAIGQCCGGVVTLVSEIYDDVTLNAIDQDMVLRRVQGDAEHPLAINRALAEVRNSGTSVTTQFISGWLLESVRKPARELWIYGAGHVGRAIISTLAPLPDFSITWVDTADARYPDVIPSNVTKLVAQNPTDVIRFAPSNAEHLILTYSHALDLELCHRLLLHGFASVGLIGSKTKWARFRARLRDLGHENANINSICCPIGQPSLGKHPQAIAVGVVATLLSSAGMQESVRDRVG